MVLTIMRADVCGQRPGLAQAPRQQPLCGLSQLVLFVSRKGKQQLLSLVPFTDLVVLGLLPELWRQLLQLVL
jgi:hypothetical protein